MTFYLHLSSCHKYYLRVMFFLCVCFCLFCGTSGWILSLILTVQQDHPKDSWAPSCWWKVFHGLLISFCFRLTCPGDLWGWYPSRTLRRWAVWAIGFPPVFTAFQDDSCRLHFHKNTLMENDSRGHSYHTCSCESACLLQRSSHVLIGGVGDPVVAHPRRGGMLRH